jgi:hypothetical protein
MRNWRMVSVAGVMLILGVAVDPGFLLHAQAGVQVSQASKALTSPAELQPLDLEVVPPVGTFYLLSDYLLTESPAPWPFCPPLAAGTAVYSLGDDGVFLVVDTASTTGIIQEFGEMNLGLRTARSSSGLTSTMSAELDFPGESDESGGGNEPLATYSYSASDLWFEIVAITNHSAWLQVHSSEVAGVYDLFATTNLGPTEPGLNVTTWIQVMRCDPGQTNLLVGDLTANECFFILAKTNDTDGDGLTDAFEKLVSHTDPKDGDQNMNYVSDGWEWDNFGSLQPWDGDFDRDGYVNYEEYLNGTDPNTISFSVAVTNHYVKANLVPVQIDVLKGVPAGMAVLVDSTNFDAATWADYQAAVNLGTQEGWHDVWIGLRGRLATSHQTWQWVRIKLDLTPPTVSITNPASATVMQPMIQVQGFCSETLAACSYDLTNAAGWVINQQVLVLDQFYDTNVWDYTTNNFQAFDVPLTNGPNTFTFHATDLAGNVSTTNFTFTLDYSGKANRPVIQLYWPQHGTRICGTNSYTWRGWVDDFTARVTAALVDTNGATNAFEAAVERDGKIWVENLPAPLGTNLLQLTVTDAAGNVSVTNIAVTASPVTLTLNPSAVSAGRLYTNVTGSIDSTNYTVWVNGVKAWLNANGTWIASNAPVTPGGTAVFQARAIPNNDNGGNGTGGGGGGNPYGPASSADNPASDQAMDRESQQNKPACVYLASYDNRYISTTAARQWRFDGPGGTCWWWSSNMLFQGGILQWKYDAKATSRGATIDDSYYGDLANPPSHVVHTTTTEDWWPVPSWGPYEGTETLVQDGQQDIYSNSNNPPVISARFCDRQERYTDAGGNWAGGYYGTYNDEIKRVWHTRAELNLFTGSSGKGVPGRTSLFELYAWASPGPANILGQLQTCYISLPDNVTMRATPTANADCYDFGVTPNKVVVELLRLVPSEGDLPYQSPPPPTYRVSPCGGDVIVTATPSPEVAERLLPSSWSFTGGTAIGSGKLQRKVNKESLVNGPCTFTATDGVTNMTIVVKCDPSPLAGWSEMFVSTNCDPHVPCPNALDGMLDSCGNWLQIWCEIRPGATNASYVVKYIHDGTTNEVGHCIYDYAYNRFWCRKTIDGRFHSTWHVTRNTDLIGTLSEWTVFKYNCLDGTPSPPNPRRYWWWEDDWGDPRNPVNADNAGNPGQW